MRKKLIYTGDFNRFTSSLTNPTLLCQECKGRIDCVGIEVCYPADDFMIIEYKISPASTEEIFKVVNS